MRFLSSPATFLVEEIPAYVPSGTGEHTFLFVEKRGLTTFDAVAALARLLGAPPREIGYAGMKDKHAVTRQWFSVPRVAPEAALAIAEPNLRVLRAERHGNKLRTGHVRGNRFEVVVTDIVGDADLARLDERLRALGTAGMPNRYGTQRFGRDADNAARGFALLRGETRERDRRRARLMLSAAQSAVFNRVLAAREAAGSLRRLITGDVLQKTPSGGIFVTEDLAVDQPRLDAGEVVITGPMPGSWAREPPEGTEARAVEDRAMAALGTTRAEFAAVGRNLPGTRRPLLVPVTVDAPAVVRLREDPQAARIGFTLPAGSYATVLVEELGIEVGAAGTAPAPDEPPDESPDATPDVA